MSNLIEIGDNSRALEFDMNERLYGWVFRRDGKKWVRERRAGQWEHYEASLQCVIKAWKPCKLQISPDELERLRRTFEALSPPRRLSLDPSTIAGVVAALGELKERRGCIDHRTLVRIRESDAELSKIAIKLAVLLDIPLWMTPPQPFTTYARTADEQASRLGDAELDTGSVVESRKLTIDCPSGGTILMSIEGRGAVFFNNYETTESPQTYRALCVLAEAIRRDNEARPQR